MWCLCAVRIKHEIYNVHFYSKQDLYISIRLTRIILYYIPKRYPGPVFLLYIILYQRSPDEI